MEIVIAHYVQLISKMSLPLEPSESVSDTWITIALLPLSVSLSVLAGIKLLVSSAMISLPPDGPET